MGRGKLSRSLVHFLSFLHHHRHHQILVPRILSSTTRSAPRPCVPACNATHHGFELLATIDGTDTKFSCNLANHLFSWVGAAALGGFLGTNVQAFVSAVISGAAGTYVLTLMEDADVGTDLVVQPGQNVIISGDAGLVEAPRWGSGGFVVREFGSLLLASVGLAISGQRLMMAQFEPEGLLTLDGVVVAHHREAGKLTGTLTMTASGDFIYEPPELQQMFPGTFTVDSGPCTLTDGGRCVGRWPSGYRQNEHCDIGVSGFGVLATCPVWDINPSDYSGGDHVTIHGTQHSFSDCPAGLELQSDESLTWDSDSAQQGENSTPLAVKGLAQSVSNLGGGWQICFV
eukprot:SAG11_NODE_864_length_6839_cov_4.807567_4_plen_343_part_00